MRTNTGERMTIVVRGAEAGDAPEIAAIHVASWIATYGRPPSGLGVDHDIAHRTSLWERRIRELTGATHVSVAVSSGSVIGFVHHGPSPDPDHDSAVTGQIHSIHVDPEITGRGIGRRLIDHAIAALRDAGFLMATLWVVEGNERARGFYQRLGWMPDGARRRETLAVEGEEGDHVDVVRYSIELGPDPEAR